jgi:hypothetical protein
MTKITARRILLLFGVLAAIFIAFGLATAGRDPIQRTYGEAGRELETAMDRLSDVAIGCSTEIVAAVEMGGASVGCTTPQAIRVALVAFGDVRTRDSGGVVSLPAAWRTSNHASGHTLADRNLFRPRCRIRSSRASASGHCPRYATPLRGRQQAPG